MVDPQSAVTYVDLWYKAQDLGLQVRCESKVQHSYWLTWKEGKWLPVFQSACLSVLKFLAESLEHSTSIHLGAGLSVHWAADLTGPLGSKTKSIFTSWSF